MSKEGHLHKTWFSRLAEEFEKDYMKELRDFLHREKQSKEIYPPGAEIFSALNHTPFDDVKVVILGQDPYHGPAQAHGLSFSVLPSVPTPPSLRNIFRELADDLSIPPATHGHLISWANQGVLLLNAVLTVERGRAGSHQNQGWEEFTDAVIRAIDIEKEGIVFLLWGSYAQKKGAFINREKHYVISSPHPSPFSASRGFFGSRPFSRTNTWLKNHGVSTINWTLPPL